MINIYNIIVSKILIGILTLGGSGIWNMTEYPMSSQIIQYVEQIRIDSENLWQQFKHQSKCIAIAQVHINAIIYIQFPLDHCILVFVQSQCLNEFQCSILQQWLYEEISNIVSKWNVVKGHLFKLGFLFNEVVFDINVFSLLMILVLEGTECTTTWYNVDMSYQNQRRWT